MYAAHTKMPSKPSPFTFSHRIRQQPLLPGGPTTSTLLAANFLRALVGLLDLFVAGALLATTSRWSSCGLRHTSGGSGLDDNDTLLDVLEPALPREPPAALPLRTPPLPLETAPPTTRFCDRLRFKSANVPDDDEKLDWP